MRIDSAEFWAAAASPEAIPPARHAEIALAGRSNVGKSSLINKMTKRRRLARTSRTPGCTRGLVFFEINSELTLVDLPGYGYASRSQQERAAWKRLVEYYLETREELAGMLVLVDVRRGPEAEEMELARFLESRGISYAWVATKSDKLKRSKLAAARSRLSERLAPARVLSTSAVKGEGLDAVWAWVEAAVADGLDG